MSSLDTPDIWYHSNDWEIEEPLRKIFKKAFKATDYNIVIKEKATPTQLRDELLNPNNIAVYWVSHAAGSDSVSTGVVSSSAVVDYYFNDVKDLFKEVHPNMRFLGLIGCNAEGTIKKFYSEGHYQDNPLLKIHSFDKKIDARTGLRRSIKSSAEKLGELKTRQVRIGGRLKKRTLSQLINSANSIKNFHETKTCNIQKQGHEIIVTRVLSEDSAQATLFVGEKLLGYFPEGKAGETQELKVYLSEELANNPQKIKFKLDSLKFYSTEKLNLGRLDFESSFQGDWKLFARRNGEPIGYTSNLYRYRGDGPSNSMVNYTKFSCYKE